MTTTETIPEPNASPAMIGVLGAITYGELKAYEEAKENARLTTTDEDRRAWERVAAQELGHHRGFKHRLEMLGADPERAMRPYRRLLDRYHGQRPGGGVEDAVWSMLGEGIAEDLLQWLARVSDPDTAAWIANVLDDEAEHEAGAEQRVLAIVTTNRINRLRALGALATMLGRLALSTEPGPLPLRAFVSVGRAPELLRTIASGYVRRAGKVAVAAAAGRQATAT